MTLPKPIRVIWIAGSLLFVVSGCSHQAAVHKSEAVTPSPALNQRVATQGIQAIMSRQDLTPDQKKTAIEQMMAANRASH